MLYLAPTRGVEAEVIALQGSWSCSKSSIKVGQIAQQLWQVSQLVWHWSVGHIVHMFEINFNDLQLWKRMVYVLVVAAIAYLLYKVVEGLFKAVQCGLRASDVQSFVSAIWGFFLRSQPCAARSPWLRSLPSAVHGSSGT